jgi:hypothetical protein
MPVIGDADMDMMVRAAWPPTSNSSIEVEEYLIIDMLFPVVSLTVQVIRGTAAAAILDPPLDAITTEHGSIDVQLMFFSSAFPLTFSLANEGTNGEVEASMVSSLSATSGALGIMSKRQNI